MNTMIAQGIAVLLCNAAFFWLCYEERDDVGIPCAVVWTIGNMFAFSVGLAEAVAGIRM